MLEMMSKIMRMELCKRYLNEPLLRYNGISFDDNAVLETISIVERVIEFRHHDTPTILENLLQCPIALDGEPNGFLYMSMVERAEFEHEDYYYIFAEEKSGRVVPLMRSKYDSGSFFQTVSNFLQSYAWKFADTILGLGEDTMAVNGFDVEENKDR